VTKSLEPLDLEAVHMVFLMWIGRLEILSVLIVFMPSYWRR
jgi:trk system potassium uptake protein TrkH